MMCFELLEDCDTRQNHNGLFASWDEDGATDISPEMTTVFYINVIGIDPSQHLLRSK